MRFELGMARVNSSQYWACSVPSRCRVPVRLFQPQPHGVELADQLLDKLRQSVVAGT